jgi:hypothetical protein
LQCFLFRKRLVNRCGPQHENHSLTLSVFIDN